MADQVRTGLLVTWTTLLEQKVAGTKSCGVAQCVEKISELKVAGTKSRGTKSRGTKSRGNLMSRILYTRLENFMYIFAHFSTTLKSRATFLYLKLQNQEKVAGTKSRGNLMSCKISKLKFAGI